MISSPPENDRSLSIVRAVLPCTTLLLGDRIDAAAAHLFREQPASPETDATSEPERWLTFLRSAVARSLDVPPYAADVAAYEAALAELSASADARRDAEFVTARNSNTPPLAIDQLAAVIPVLGKHVRIEQYAFDAPAIVSAIENCDRLAGLERVAATTVLLVRLADRARPHTFRINRGTQLLLTACSGGATGTEIVGRMRTELTHERHADLERRVVQTLETLRAKHILTYLKCNHVEVRDR